MADISNRSFDGTTGGPVGGGFSRVEPQPDFTGWTQDQIDNYLAANAVSPETGALPASAVINPVTEQPVEKEQDNRDVEQLAAEQPTLSVLPGGGGEPSDPEAEQHITAQFYPGQPFVHVEAILGAGPLQLVLSVDEAVTLYNVLGPALGEAYEAGAFTQ